MDGVAPGFEASGSVVAIASTSAFSFGLVAAAGDASAAFDAAATAAGLASVEEAAAVSFFSNSRLL